jgi:hypothetical protein
VSARAVGSPTDPVGTRIGSIEASPGELRFVVDLAGTSREIWIRSSVPVVSGADAAVALALTPAMTVPGPLRVDAPVDELFARRVPEIQGIFRSWAKSGEWPGIEAARHQVELLCPRSETPPCDPDAGVGAFFSGGVDSFATLLRNPEITDLIYIQGFDVPVGDLFAAYHARMRDTVGRVADGLDKSLITVETNARELYEPTLKGPAFGGGFRAGVVRFLAPRLGRIYTASGLHYDRLAPNSGHPLLDHLWGAGRVEFVHDGAELRRVDKLELIAGNTIAQATLRVCWADPESERNCGRCEKCLRTMVALEALGARERFETFPPELDLEAVAALSTDGLVDLQDGVVRLPAAN